MCIDHNFCGYPKVEDLGIEVSYFEEPAYLICGAKILALGSTIISAYLAY